MGLSGSSPSGDRLIFRPADLGDADFLLALRNDPETRGFSFTQHRISKDEHQGWLKRRLADPASLLWIALDKELPIGQLRLTRLDDFTAEVDIAVAAGSRGKGIGRSIIVRGADLCEASWPRVVRLRALIAPENTASLRAFSAAGYGSRSPSDPRGVSMEHVLSGGGRR
jgi:UDP-2,4-diacetamido-2,4,6-trideoxy-beta-L-altropyranose hydrolase